MGTTISRGWKEISRGLRVKEDKARELAAQGAPIYFDGMVPYAEMSELWEWRKLQLGRSTMDSVAKGSIHTNPVR